MPDAHVAAGLGAFAIGALDPEEALQVRAHLAECADCADLLADYRAVARALAAERDHQSAGPPPWERMRARILPQPAARRWSRQRRVLVGGWIATAALLALVSGWTAWDHLSGSGNDVATVAGGTTGTVVRLEATGASSSSPSGQLYVSGDGSQGALVVAGLSTSGGPYEVWFIRPDQTRVSGGTFDVDPRGSALVKLQLPAPLTQFSGVTVCPAGPDWEWKTDLLAGPIS